MINSKAKYCIPVENIYHMLRYVYEGLEEEEIGTLDEGCYINLAELLSELLLRSIIKQLKRGLFREYVSFSGPVMMIKGKIDMNASIKLKTQLSRQLYCNYDDFSTNNRYNQIIKSTFLFMIRQGRVGQKTRRRIKEQLFFFNEIEEIPLQSVIWENIRFHKDKFAYRTLIGLCYLIYKGMEEDEVNEIFYFNDKEMGEVYESFTRHFFIKESPKLHIGYQGKYRSKMLESGDYLRNSLLVDMILRYQKNKMIFSSHYFPELLVENEEGKAFVLEQISRLFVTIKNSKINVEGKLMGALIYPSVVEHYLDTYPIEAYNIYIGAVNLTLPFERIRQQLLGINQLVIES